MNAQPDSERFPLLAAIAAQRAREARPDPRRDDLTLRELTEPRYTLSWRSHNREVVVDLDDLDDDAFDALPERVRRWQPAKSWAALEDIRYMAESGETMAGVCARLSALRGREVTPDAVGRLLHRCRAYDVLAALTGYGEDPPPVPRRWLRRKGGLTPQAGSEPQPQPAASSRAATPRAPVRRIMLDGVVRGVKV